MMTLLNLCLAKRTWQGAALAAVLVLTGCGENGKNSDLPIPLPDVDFPLPKVDENRPKTGREALFNVPWTSLKDPQRDGNIFGKSYLLITKDSVSRVVMCAPIVVVTGGERKWITPTATAKIVWSDKGEGDGSKGSFTTQNEEVVTAKEKLEGRTCAVSLTPKATYNYEIGDDGKLLSLTSKGKDGKEILDVLVIFRNK